MYDGATPLYQALSAGAPGPSRGNRPDDGVLSRKQLMVQGPARHAHKRPGLAAQAHAATPGCRGDQNRLRSRIENPKRDAPPALVRPDSGHRSVTEPIAIACAARKEPASDPERERAQSEEDQQYGQCAQDRNSPLTLTTGLSAKSPDATSGNRSRLRLSHPLRAVMVLARARSLGRADEVLDVPWSGNGLNVSRADRLTTR